MLDDATIENLKKKEIVTFSGTGKPPSPNLQPDYPRTGQPSWICANFSTKGYYCKNKNCSFFHLHRLSDLPLDQQTKYKNWVASQPNLSFTGGGGNTTTSGRGRGNPPLNPAPAPAPAPANGESGTSTCTNG